MSVTVFIEYKLDLFKLTQFEQHANRWGEIIPICGGDLLGYLLPHEGSNKLAFGLITFDSLGDYERYRRRLRKDQQGDDNFQFAHTHKFILEEKRSFLTVVSGTYKQPPRSLR
ncbi:NIPSNAP family protein [Microbulbifer sp. SAOS-129_SWC]|uniref:NIPSNAP family protein n=1 Tax=Microbulbifer sp. SAOS-129_SWC TaxID=3145235 RepID=UPI0032165B58